MSFSTYQSKRKKKYIYHALEMAPFESMTLWRQEEPVPIRDIANASQFWEQQTKTLSFTCLLKKEDQNNPETIGNLNTSFSLHLKCT